METCLALTQTSLVRVQSPELIDFGTDCQYSLVAKQAARVSFKN